MKRAISPTATLGKRAATAAVAVALALALGTGPAGADALHPYLVGFWNEGGLATFVLFEIIINDGDDRVIAESIYNGFELRIINPTPDDLLAVVAVFDSDENPFACARVLLTPNDEALLRAHFPIWLPYGSPIIIEDGDENIPRRLIDFTEGPIVVDGDEFIYPLEAREGVIKIVSLSPAGSDSPVTTIIGGTRPPRSGGFFRPPPPSYVLDLD